MRKQEVRSIIEKVGIVPVIRASSAEEARFAADCVANGGVPIVEITMTVPGAVEVIRELVKAMPQVLVGAGTVLNEGSARQCADAGAQFLVTPGFNAQTVAAARERDLLIMVGALTPSEIMAASEAGADFVKVFPCGSMGGPKYIQALRGPFPKVPFVPTGGVNVETAADYIRAGAAALGVGGEMISKDALKARDGDVISKLAALFVDLVRDARPQ
jgi:2-dehydro-3-deoxyphosphogluconate aldolase/(4S)-4-hydroxy-2-oxoglutarate aldolase